MARRDFEALRSESGQTLVEYALIVAGIGLVCLVAVSFLSGRVGGLFESASNSPAFTPPTAAGPDASENNRSTLVLALPAINLYHDAHGGWAGMTYPALHALDSAVDPIVVVYGDDTGYCVTNTGDQDLWYRSSDAGLTQTPCASP